MTHTSEEVARIAAGLSGLAKAMLRRAKVDRYAGTWVGDGDAVMELHEAGLTEREPEDGGGTWGKVAPLNALGLAVRDHLMKGKSEP